MHRTLKKETATPPAFTLKEQQDRFDEFRRCFNRERPHEALAFGTPNSVYVRAAERTRSFCQKSHMAMNSMSAPCEKKETSNGKAPIY
jgi:hypothetical protein